MKRSETSLLLKCFGLLLLVVCLNVSCKNTGAVFSADESKLVKDSVTTMTANIASDVSKKGPIAWLDYFEDLPGFFMASDGQMAFKDYASAKTVILNTLVKGISKITLNWQNVRVDPLTPAFANFGADFHEDLVLSHIVHVTIDGYVTATAHFDGNKWKLRNMNWAIKAPGKKP
jgi:hypothetical protein